MDPASDPAGYASLHAGGPTVAAIGKFDGIHRGHLSLLSHAISDARRRSLQAGAVTFDVHPAQVIHGQQRQYLTTIDERVDLLAAAGLDFVLVLRGSAELYTMAADVFASRLIAALDCRGIVVGANFRFGRDRAGDVRTFDDVGAPLGARATALELVTGLGEAVSSSRIRAEVRRGNVGHAAELLGRPFSVVGVLGETELQQDTVAIPPNLVRPPAGRYDGWLEPMPSSDRRRTVCVVMHESADVATVAVPDAAPLDARRGDRVRVGFTRLVTA